MFGLPSKQVEFFVFFERAARNAVRSAELLADLAKVEGCREELVSAIVKAEHDGDEITHETLIRLERTYATPIDRGDIHDLISRIDDVVDTIDAVGQRMMFYKIAAVRQDFAGQCAVLAKASHLMADAVSGLRRIKDRKPPNAGSFDELTRGVHQAEEEGDDIHHQFLAKLFDAGLDPFQIIKWKELCELVEHAIDCCDDVACVVHRIAMKYA